VVLVRLNSICLATYLDLLFVTNDLISNDDDSKKQTNKQTNKNKQKKAGRVEQ